MEWRQDQTGGNGGQPAGQPAGRPSVSGMTPVILQRRNPPSGAFGACSTVLIVTLDDLPDWCSDHLGGEPAEMLFQVQQISMVFDLRLAGGTDVVVKARPDDGGAVSCVTAQARPGRARVSVRYAEVFDRLMAARLPCVLGYADFETQNLRWHGQQVRAVHDWDSLAWQPEAALAGAASGGAE